MKCFVEKFWKRKIWPEIASLGLLSCVSVTWLEVLFCASDLETEYPCLPSMSFLNIWENPEGYWKNYGILQTWYLVVKWCKNVQIIIFISICLYNASQEMKEIISCCWFANLLKLSILQNVQKWCTHGFVWFTQQTHKIHVWLITFSVLEMMK